MDVYYKNKQYDIPQIITQTEYDALTDEEKAASGLVVIKDDTAIKFLFNGELPNPNAELDKLLSQWRSNLAHFFTISSSSASAPIKPMGTIDVNLAAGGFGNNIKVNFPAWGIIYYSSAPNFRNESTLQLVYGVFTSINESTNVGTFKVYQTTMLYPGTHQIVRGGTRAEFDALTLNERFGLYVITDEKVLMYNNNQVGGSDASTGASIPTGGIIIWSGAADQIPDGWALCDGNNGTPNLQDRFVLCAGTSHAVGSTGGAEEVTLTVAQIPKHSHSISCWPSPPDSGALTASLPTLIQHTSSQPININTSNVGLSQPHPNIPPYYTLAYIMKL